jgi:hypothetical protein
MSCNFSKILAPNDSIKRIEISYLFCNVEDKLAPDSWQSVAIKWTCKTMR